jgi:phosphatidylethanolamine-binding protein (PEBP) family uncharacterized protein
MTFKAIFSGLSLLALAACGGGGGGGGTGTGTGSGGVTPSTAFTLTSTAFSNGATIPNAYRCVNSGGGGKLPQLSWTNLPTGTKSLIVIMDDTDAQAVQGSTYTHYFALIPYQTQVAALSAIDEVSNPSLPYEKVWTTSSNNWVVLSDLPPCNPQTTAHTYRWTIYALNTEYNSIPSMKSQFEEIINNAINSTTVVENLNYLSVNGSSVQAIPRFTRSSFESTYGSFILDKVTLSGTM